MTRRALLVMALLAGCLLAPGAARGQGRAGAETEEEKIFGDAEAAFDAGRYGDAAPLYDRALLLNPTRPATFVKRATLYFRERRYDQAIDLLLRAEKLAPDDLNLKTVLGLCLYQSGQTDRALRYLTDVTARRPETSEAQLQVGQHYAQKDPDRAIGALQLYLKHRPEEQRPLDAVAQLHMGQALYAKGRWKEALASLEAAARARPKDAQTQLSLGAAVLARGDYARAARIFEPFLADRARRPRVAYNLALCYLKLGRPVEANRLAGFYAEKRPNDPRAQVLLGDVALAGGKDVHVRAALRYYEEAGRLSRAGNEVPRVSLEARVARAHLIGHDPARAIVAAEPALSRGPRPAEEAELLSVLLEAAIEEVRAGAVPRPLLLPTAARLSQLLPQDASAQALCGSAALAAASLERARKYYGDALVLDPKLRRARTGMARTLNHLALAGLEEASGAALALGLLELAAPLDDTTMTARNLSALYLMQGRAVDAERVLQPVVGGIGKTDVALLRLHARALVTVRPEGALPAYERALGEAQKGWQAADGRERPALLAQIGELRVDLGARYLQLGQWNEAIEALERAGREIGEEGEGRRTVRRDLSLAYLFRGRSRLADLEGQLAQGLQIKGAEAALEDLQKALDRGGLAPGRREAGTTLCLAALAATQAARYHLGRELLGKAQAEGGCELSPPYDKLGIELFSVYISYRDTGSLQQRERALRALPRLSAKAGASAPLAGLLRALLRSADLLAAYDHYAVGRTARAAQLLRAAQKVTAGKGEEIDPVLVHNLAVVDLLEGRAGAERTLERLGARPPEALLNLGILKDRRGEARKALDLYKRALEKGARSPKLREWIDLKERIIGAAP